MSLYLAVDGGNSKTDVVIGSDAGEVLSSVRGPDTCYQVIGLPETLARMRSLIGRAFDSAGLAPGTVVDHGEFLLAGADLPVEVSMLTEALDGLRVARGLRVENDAFAVLRAVTDGPDAIAVVCGTGINCVGRRGADGRTARFLSVGDVSGDWGGGSHLGALAMWHAIRGEDGRGPQTALTAAVADYFGMARVHDVAAAMHLETLDIHRRKELTPLLFWLAADGDAVARSVVAQQADEIVALAGSAAARLDLLDSPHAVGLGGAVLRAQHPLLNDAILDGVRARAPKATVSVVDAPPVLGAALYALDAMGASAEAHERLRATLR
jgi:N-acetylglucosamine kinase-like BadF-type ATPase